MKAHINNRVKFLQNPFVIFLPFLLIYVLVVLLLQSDSLWGDEGRYLIYAQNLLHGFYSGPDINLAAGPGYPIFLMPFVATHSPLLIIRLVNPLFYYLSIVFLFKVLRQFSSFKISILVCIFWGCYFNAYENLPLMLTETFTLFLVSALMLCLSKAFNPAASKKYTFLSGFLFGYIALTKVIFGYVMLFMLIGSIIFWIFKRSSLRYKKAALIFIVAMVTTLPYLIYTYNLTGKIFYWSTVSGNNLYWMSSPYKNEFGDWLKDPIYGISENAPFDTHTTKYSGGTFNLKNRMHFFMNSFADSIASNHQDDYAKINQTTTALERDNEFRKIAINNIQSHPLKFIKNWLSNIGRIVFNLPYSYRIEKPGTLLRLPFTGILAVLSLFCWIPTLMNWKRIDFPIRFMILFVFVYLGGSSLGSAETRMFTISVPILLVWITYILKKTTTVKFRFQSIEHAV